GTRLAGVSSFGMSGTNVHAIIEQAPEQNFVPPEVAERSHHILSLSAKSEEALYSLANRYQQFLESHPEVSLADICFTANTGRDHFEHRLSVVTKSKVQLKEQLKAFSIGEKTTGVASGNLTHNQRPKIAFLFTGQGSQYVGMGRQLFETQPVFRAALLRCDEILRSYLDKPLLEILYPEPNQTSPLNETAYTQPSLFAFEYALAELWQSWGVKPDVVMGHSLGEYVAACIAGVFSLEEALKLIVHRAAMMQALPTNGEMVAVFAGEELVRDCLNSFGQEVGIAGINSPQNTVISGRHHAVTEIVAALEAQGIESKKLNVSHAFHSPLMEPMLNDFQRVASQVSYSRPQIEIISNVTGELATDEIATPDYWCRHIRLPVKFTASLETLHQKGYELFLEIGAKPTLLGMGRQCLTGSEKVWLPSLRWGQEDWQQMLESLGELYVGGVPVDWSSFDRDYPRRKVVLPTYPFQHKGYWVEAANSHPEQYLFPTNSQVFHPLLGQQLRLPFSNEIRFESQFSPNSPSFMKDHKLFGITVVPAASYVATALSAAKEALGTESCVLEDLFFPQALVIPENSSKTVQVLLTQEETEVYSFQIISLKEGQDENKTNSWKLHGTGKIRLSNAEIQTTAKETIDIKAVQVRCQQSLSKEEFYQPIWDFGYTLGSLFQWNQKVWRQEGEAWCQIEPPSELLEKEISEYQLYPGLIDSCLQLLVNLLQDDAAEASQNQEIYLPFIIEKFKFYQSPKLDRQLWCQAKRRDSQNGNQGKLWGDIRILDETGEIIAEIEGFELRKASQQLLQQELNQNADNLLYEIAWKPQERKPANLSINSERSGNWLIFADRGGMGQEIAKLLSEHGANCILAFADRAKDGCSYSHYAIDPTNPEDFKQLFQQHQFQGILHLWSLDDSLSATTTFTDIQKAQELGCASVLHLIQALFEQPENTQLPRLCLVTKGAMSVGDTPHNLNVGQTPLWGLGKVIGLEHPDLERLLIDIDPTGGTESIPALVEEVLSPEKEDQIAFRQELRYVGRLINSTEFASVNQLQFDENGSYLITGGLGALGIKVASWLVERGVRNLILTGRRDASEKAQKAIAKLESFGAKVLVVKADVSNFEEVAQTFQIIESQMSPLCGVIHAAGVLDDGLILRQDWSSFNRVMAPKVAGSWNLHRLTEELPLDFFICFSSVASLIGSPGQGNYAAANAFMDALCHHRRSLGLPGSSINWGPWAGEGMAANAPKQWQQLLAGWGFKSLAAEQGLEALGQILHHQPIQLGVVPIDWSKFIGQFAAGAESLMFSEVVDRIPQQEKTVKSEKKKLQLLQQLQTTTPSQRQKLLIIYIQEQLVEVLKFEPSQRLNPQQGFFEMGIDSLMTIELKNKFEQDLGCSLPSTLFFKYPTLESLAEYLVSKLIKSDVTQVSDVQSQAEEEAIELTNIVNDVEQISEAEAEELLLAKLATF
ncbi:MAG: type I polyketide synthase, partial [Xenococcaceae cyanobacterium MO_234.B1]|nr:type I polyketide synthase [Xenococcaceae cyanobacterium MO_234.B1]